MTTTENIQTTIVKPPTISPAMPKGTPHEPTGDEKSLPLLGIRRLILLAERDGVKLGVETQMPGLSAALLRFLKIQTNLPDDVRADVQNTFNLTVESGEPSPELKTLIQLHGQRFARLALLGRPNGLTCEPGERFDVVVEAMLGDVKSIRRKESVWLDTAQESIGKLGHILMMLRADDSAASYPRLHILAQAPTISPRADTWWP